MSGPFSSPLRAGHGPFASIDFGAIARAAEVEALASRLQGRILALADGLPSPLDREAHALLSAYSGNGRRFIDLFYTPIWSFLHWALPRNDPAAEQAHASALFLHLWDDHLTDGQLKPDILRLQLRTDAWATFLRAARALGGDALGLADRYLVAQRDTGEVDTLEGYCRRFVDEIGIWRVVPSLLGDAAGPVTAIVTDFATAWRLIDDVQDVAEDLAARKRSALWHALDVRGRALWATCEDASAEAARDAWAALQPALFSAAADVTLLARRLLSSASTTARASQWPGWAEEIEAAATFAGPPSLSSC